MTWYSKVSADISLLPDFITFCNGEIDSARRDVSIHGNIEKNIAALPGITEHRFNQLQEVEAVLRFMELQHRMIKKKYFKKYLEGYAKALTSRDAEKYADAEQEVVDYEMLINEVALIRNKFLGVLKGIDSKNFMLGHVARLRTAGMEDVAL